MLRQALALMLFTLFSLGTFGVTIEQHLCCHTNSSENNNSHCNDDESCCDNKEDCCDEIISTIKIAKDFTQQTKQTTHSTQWIATNPTYIQFSGPISFLCPAITIAPYYFSPPPLDIQTLYCSFLI